MAVSKGHAAYASAIRRQRKADEEARMWDQTLSGLSQLGAWAVTKVEAATTAWDEYKTGYEELGGDPTDIPERGGFFKQLGQTLMPGGDKGFFQRPEGEVTIGKRIYDRENLREVGGFLGTDEARRLDPEGREYKGYISRTAPGRDLPSTTFTSGLKLGQSEGIDPTMDYTGVDPQEYDTLVRSRQGGGVGAKFQGARFGQGTGRIKGPSIQKSQYSVGPLDSQRYAMERALEDERLKEQWRVKERLDRMPNPLGERYDERQYNENMNVWDSMLENNKRRKTY